MSSDADPALGAVAVTLGADITPNYCRGLYVGTTGDVSVQMSAGTSPIVFVNVQGGTVLPIRVRRVNASGTTASNIIALY